MKSFVWTALFALLLAVGCASTPSKNVAGHVAHQGWDETDR